MKSRNCFCEGPFTFCKNPAQEAELKARLLKVTFATIKIPKTGR